MAVEFATAGLIKQRQLFPTEGVYGGYSSRGNVSYDELTPATGELTNARKSESIINPVIDQIRETLLEKNIFSPNTQGAFYIAKHVSTFVEGHSIYHDINPDMQDALKAGIFASVSSEFGFQTELKDNNAVISYTEVGIKRRVVVNFRKTTGTLLNSDFYAFLTAGGFLDTEEDSINDLREASVAAVINSSKTTYVIWDSPRKKEGYYDTSYDDIDSPVDGTYHTSPGQDVVESSVNSAFVAPSKSSSFVTLLRDAKLRMTSFFRGFLDK